MEKKLKNIFIICGKARSGKKEVSNLLEEMLANCVSLSITKPLKDYAKLISDWDGLDATKPRTLLQTLGIDVIKNQIDDKFLIKRILEDIEVLSFYKKNILITGVRLQEEINCIKEKYPNTIVLKVIRPNFDNQLTDKEKEHITENDLNMYKADFEIINDKTLEDLKIKLNQIKEGFYE